MFNECDKSSGEVELSGEDSEGSLLVDKEPEQQTQFQYCTVQTFSQRTIFNNLKKLVFKQSQKLP